VTRTEPVVSRTCDVCGTTATVPLSKADAHFLGKWDGNRCPDCPPSEAVLTLDENTLT
jgi:hypothetical protein